MKIKYSFLHLKKIYIDSILDLLIRPAFWICSLAILVFSSLFLIIFPKTAFDAFDGSMPLILPYVLPIVIFFSSLISETNVETSEFTYIMTRPIKRKTYMISKILSSLTIVICIFCVIELPIILIGKFCIPTGDVNNLKEINLSQLCITFLMYMILGSLLGTCFKFYMRDKITSIILLLIFLILYMGLSIVFPQKYTKMDSFAVLYNIQTLWIPFTVCLPMMILGTAAGIFYIGKVDIKI